MSHYDPMYPPSMQRGLQQMSNPNHDDKGRFSGGSDGKGDMDPEGHIAAAAKHGNTNDYEEHSQAAEAHAGASTYHQVAADKIGDKAGKAAHMKAAGLHDKAEKLQEKASNTENPSSPIHDRAATATRLAVAASKEAWSKHGVNISAD